MTLVLTFRSDSAVEQSLTFDAQLEPGDYAFFSRSDPDSIVGRVRIVEPGRP